MTSTNAWAAPRLSSSAVDAGDDGVGEAELGDALGDAAGLVEVDGFGAALGTAQKPQRRVQRLPSIIEGGGLLVPALADVGALRALADGVQVQVAASFLRCGRSRRRGAGFEPLGLRTGRRGARSIWMRAGLAAGGGAIEVICSGVGCWLRVLEEAGAGFLAHEVQEEAEVECSHDPEPRCPMLLPASHTSRTARDCLL